MKWIKIILVIISVTASVDVWAAQCTVSTVAVNFGNYDATAGAPLNTTGSISVVCTPATMSVVKLDPGHNSGGDFNQRKMLGDVNYLNYNLYTDAAFTKVWGDGTGNTFTQTGSGNLTVYGRIPPLQNVRPGVYTDFVTILVEW